MNGMRVLLAAILTGGLCGPGLAALPRVGLSALGPASVSFQGGVPVQPLLGPTRLSGATLLAAPLLQPAPLPVAAVLPGALPAAAWEPALGAGAAVAAAPSKDAGSPSLEGLRSLVPEGSLGAGASTSRETQEAQTGERLAALMDGRRAQPVSEAQENGAEAAHAALRERLKDWSRQDVPVRIRWRNPDSGGIQEAVVKVGGVLDTTSWSAGRQLKRWMVMTDVYLGQVDVDMIESAAPAGLSSDEYNAAIQPERPRPLSEELARTGLSSDQIGALTKHSRGFMTVQDFLRSAPVPAGSGVAALGVTDNLDQYTALVRAAGLVHWKTLYRKWLGSIRNPRADEFMTHVTGADRPVVMFLPPKILEPENYPFTSEELRWLLAHPERMKNVQFVLGAYEMFSKENEGKLFSLGLRNGKGQRRRLLRERFEAMSSRLKP